MRLICLLSVAYTAVAVGQGSNKQNAKDQRSSRWPNELVGEWTHPVDKEGGLSDTVVLRLRANGRYDKYEIYVRQGFDGPSVSAIDTVRKNLRWQARRAPDSEHSAAHDEICFEWHGEVGCGWY